jgi:hypothetical protein
MENYRPDRAANVSATSGRSTIKAKAIRRHWRDLGHTL